MSINQAHLIHDQSSGRSSTRLHAPPGGGNAMGTSFGWGDDAPAPSAGRAQVRNPNPVSNDAPANPAPAPRARKGEFVDSRIGAHAAPPVNNENVGPGAQAGSAKGFGDTGASSVKVHHAPGGKSSGNILSWS
eukprot:CAMPEP_0181325256 /NCGR_PEP_ID=MMETSP1101-20121128/20820_1 /TAXON_ID=46948 /ORGANISM="Rhodomonas abbreviata, Strain Caron Lab Isolate" /LENGTH=132 /DNA_ID=CAMNT_0023433535 /DNA_START=157 /DNA_END=555 /DNA_ORIENTATION=+